MSIEYLWWAIHVEVEVEYELCQNDKDEIRQSIYQKPYTTNISVV